MDPVRDTEARVLKNYTIANPSYINLDAQSFLKHLERRRSLFQHKLRLPTQLFKKSRCLDFGAGTGEQDLCYAHWGAALSLVEINPKSVDLLLKYFDMFKLSDQLEEIYNGSVFDFSPNGLYNIVISEGVLHHTDDPELGFELLVKHLAPDGFVVLQLASDSAYIQRSIQRLILDQLTHGDYDKINAIAPELFSENLRQASSRGGRSISQLVHDVYINPKHRAHSFLEILGWFQKHGITYYSSYPSFEPENLINGVHTDGGPELFALYPELSAFANAYFMVARDEDEDYIEILSTALQQSQNSLEELMDVSGFRDYEYGAPPSLEDVGQGLSKYVSSIDRLFEARSDHLRGVLERFKDETFRLLEVVKSGDPDLVKAEISSFEQIFRGYNGVPGNYIVGYRR